MAISNKESSQSVEKLMRLTKGVILTGLAGMFGSFFLWSMPELASDLRMTGGIVICLGIFVRILALPLVLKAK